MSTINLHNYEAYLLDYFERNLSEDLVVELKAFVLAHPNLEIDLDDRELPVFTKEEIDFDFKNELFKSEENIPGEELILYLEGKLSPAERSAVEARLAADTQLAKELERFKKTVLLPEITEAFTGKDQLIKTEQDLVLNNRAIAFFENTLDAAGKTAFAAGLAVNKDLRTELALIAKTKLQADTDIVYPNKEALKKEARVIALFNFRVVAAAAVLLLIGLVIVFMVYNSSPGFKKIEVGKKENINLPDIKNNAPVKKEIVPEQDSRMIAKSSSIESNKNNANVPHKKTVVSIPKDEINLVNQPKEESLPLNPIEEKKDTVGLANHNPKKENQEDPANASPAVTRYTNVNALALAKDEDVETNLSDKPKNGFWKRAVKLASQVNGLGLKAVKGDEKGNENYSLSFNSFSVEKK